jgi:hypothetical protein
MRNVGCFGVILFYCLLFVCAMPLQARSECQQCPKGNTACFHNDLSTSVAVPDGNWNLEACYVIYGNAEKSNIPWHDGVEAWIQTDDPAIGANGVVADYALPPEALGTYQASTTVARCEVVPVSGPLVITGTVVTAANSIEDWGCSSPKLHIPSSISFTLERAR